ncbi:MAG TPA: PTS transporter subunit EIIC [Methylomusa anaerophila]|uniref:PTS system EIIBC component n=1 Tax=Methylomusa anaerophila TaxID=1930071 RepID=A0A348AG45_9FIRM|nr:PTS transporter subunit EIIC [Methylomusa anaerophila]BBB90043.1 PTS system EIIBC component [Methylomusa anaerophila]HML88230.1 PTS transporter subunit EIIC [Methylomusa anaerophila]
MSKERELAEQIVVTVGGKNNIIGAAHCMTRLRLTLADLQKANQIVLKKIPGVLGAVEQAGQLQIILGPGIVNKVAGVLNEITGLKTGEVRDLKTACQDQNRTPFKLFLRKLANIFVPLIPAIVGSGMVAGITNIAVQSGADPQGTFIAILNVIGWGIFSYLGVFVGINAAKEFGGTPALGGLAGVLIINPAIATIKINGLALVPGRGGLIGILLAAWFISWVEKQLRKVVPHALDIVVTPALTLLITGLATYYVLQPVGGVLSDGIIAFFKNMISIGGVVAGFTLAGTFLPVIMSGMHQGLVPVHMEFLNTLKENPLLPILAMGGAGQVGAAFAVYLKTKNNKLKQIVKGALPVGLLGIGEPLIFGVTLPLGRPFITACIGAGFGGAFQAAAGVKSIALGVSGLPLTFLIKPGGAGLYLAGLAIAYAAGFIVTWVVGFEDPKDEE